MNRAQEWLRALGPTGVVGIGVLIFCIPFYFSAVRPAERELQVQRSVAERLRARVPFQPVVGDGRAEELRRFYSLFPPLEKLPDQLDLIYGLAKSAKLELLQGEYRLEKPPVGLAYYRVNLPLRAPALLPAALTVLDIVGWALLIGGLSLRVPQIGALAHVSTGLIFALSGLLIPVNLYPGWVQVIARVLPTTLGIEALRKTMLAGQSLGAIWTAGTLPLLAVHAVGLAVLGWIIFLVNDRHIKQHGISH